MHLELTNTRIADDAPSVRSFRGTTPNIKFLWLILISAILRWIPFLFSPNSSLIDFKRVCIILSYLLLLFALLRNIHLWGVRSVALGSFLNFVAILVNQGFMPVSPEARYLAGKTLLETPSNGLAFTGSGGVVLPIEQTNLWFLTDFIPVHSIHAVFSIGDIIIGFGMLVTFASLVISILPVIQPKHRIWL